jgi:hypothetical protein
MSFYRVGDTGILFSQDGPLSVDFSTGPVDPVDPTITPLALDSRLIVTGHSIPDAIVQGPLQAAIGSMGGTSQIWSSTGPYATAGWRWDNRPVNPHEVRGLMEAPGAAYDIFLGIEAHGGTYDGRASVATHIEYSDAYGYATLWHNLAASTGAQTHYANFWRNDPALLFGGAWRAAQDLEVPLWDGIIDYVNANKAGGTPTMRLVPWLQVFCAVYDGIQSGAVTGVTMGQFFEDDVHNNTPMGRWLAIATLLAVAYRRHPDTLPANAGVNANISEALAAQLRPIVWSTCLATTRTGLAA